MVKCRIILTGLYFLIIPFCIQSMDPPTNAKQIDTLLWLEDNMIIASSRNTCYLKNPFSKVATIPLHDQLAENIILNKDKTKVGLFCQKGFFVYDITTTKKIWSLPLSYSDNYSATFSPTDDIIICHKGKATINYKTPLNLPFLEQDNFFPITCNAKTKEIMYPSSNNTFSRKSLENNDIFRHPRIWNENGKKYKVSFALYNPYNNHIILHAYHKTHEHNEQSQEFFLLHTKTNSITRLTSSDLEENPLYYTVKILPNSSIAAALCDKAGIHFFDFIQQRQILLELLHDDNRHSCKSNKNVLDFNANASYYATITHRKYFRRETPKCLLRYIFAKSRISFIYFALCNYFEQKNLWIPKDIKRILIEYFHAVYNLDKIQ